MAKAAKVGRGGRTNQRNEQTNERTNPASANKRTTERTSHLLLLRRVGRRASVARVGVRANERTLRFGRRRSRVRSRVGRANAPLPLLPPPSAARRSMAASGQHGKCVRAQLGRAAPSPFLSHKCLSRALIWSPRGFVWHALIPRQCRAAPFPFPAAHRGASCFSQNVCAASRVRAVRGRRGSRGRVLSSSEEDPRRVSRTPRSPVAWGWFSALVGQNARRGVAKPPRPRAVGSAPRRSENQKGRAGGWGAGS